MNISEPFIRRPVATSLLSVALLLAGLLAYRMLPVAPLPQVEFPVIQVQAQLPGASPETMASSVATPLERQFARIAGVTEMTSTSLLGATTIVLQFDLDRSIDAAARDVQAAINAARSQLPPNLPNNPNYRKINPADAPILILGMTSDALTVGRMFDAADSIVAQKLSQVEGVGQVVVGGGARPAVRVRVDPNRLAQLGIGLGQVRAAIAAATANRPKGELADATSAWAVSANSQLFDADQYRPVIITYRNGAPVRLGDIAEVESSVEDVRTAGLVNSKRAVVLIVYRQPGANVIETVDRVLELMPELRASIPPAINLSVVLDRTTSIRPAFRDIQVTLLLSIALVVFVVFIFLRSVSATVIPSVAVPLSLLGTFGGMYLLGYSLNNLSLMALTICTGFVVDDAIVVLENITRYIEQGDTPLQAALKGSREIGFTVLSMTVSLVAVFLPILLMGGLVGRLFREFAVTLTLAVTVSLLVSLTVTPMMCARLLKSAHTERHGRFYRFGGWAVDSLRRLYALTLRGVLRHPALTALLTLATVGVNVYLFVLVPKGFFPQQDTGRIIGSIQAEQDISFPAMQTKLADFARLVLEDPAVTNVIAFTGGAGNTTNSGRMFISLKSHHERDASADQVITRLRGKLGRVPGASLFLQAVQDVRIGGRQSNAQYQYTLQSPNLDELNAFAPQMLGRLRNLPELRDVASDQQNRGLQAAVVIDRDTASRLGRARPGHRRRALRRLRSAPGRDHLHRAQPVPGRAGGRLRLPAEPGRARRDLRPLVDRRPGAAQCLHALRAPHHAAAGEPPGPVPGGDAVVQPGRGRGPGRRREGRRRPPSARPASPRRSAGSFQGTAQAFQASLANQPILILAALIAVYLVLGVLYESLIHPITILSTLPSAGIGRDPRADPVPHGPEHHRDDRPAPPHRHRQEERHPDDRLRGRRQPAPESDAAGRDLRGLSAALPADHDDDDGRPARRLAARARHRARLRAPPPAGRHHRGRADPVPAPDAVHDAGRLPVPRASPAVARPAPGIVVRTESIEARA